MILTVTLNASVDLTLFVNGLLSHDTNRVQRVETDAGGKGLNVARIAAECGAQTVATGFLGGGPSHHIRAVLKAQGVEDAMLPIQGETRINIVVEDGSGKPPTTFNMTGPEILPHEFEALKQRIQERMAGAKWVCFGGSVPPGLPKSVFADLIRLVRPSGAKVVLDADSEALVQGVTAGPDFVKPNADEAARLLGRRVKSEFEAIEAAQEIRAMTKNPEARVVLSRGSHGAVMAGPEGVHLAHPPMIRVQSTIGSGDSLVGAMLASIERGENPVAALAWGVAAGAATATTNGAEIGRKAKIEELLPQVKVLKAAG